MFQIVHSPFVLLLQIEPIVSKSLEYGLSGVFMATLLVFVWIIFKTWRSDQREHDKVIKEKDDEYKALMKEYVEVIKENTSVLNQVKEMLK